MPSSGRRRSRSGILWLVGFQNCCRFQAGEKGKGGHVSLYTKRFMPWYVGRSMFSSLRGSCVMLGTNPAMASWLTLAGRPIFLHGQNFDNPWGNYADYPEAKPRKGEDVLPCSGSLLHHLGHFRICSSLIACKPNCPTAVSARPLPIEQES